MSRSVNGHGDPAGLAFAAARAPANPAGLPGRAELDAALVRLLQSCADEAGSIAALALLQLANFYEIRSWVGRSAADHLLGEIAAVVAHSIPAAAGLYRCGFYELALILPDGGAAARRAAAAIGGALDTAVFDALPPQARLRCAVGLVDLDATVASPAVALARARASLDERPAATARPTLSLSALGEALRAGGLQLNFQPVVDLRGRDPARYELRSSLIHGGECLDGESLYTLAGQHAFGETLDHLVLQRALRMLARNRSLHLLVNISLNSLVSGDLPGWLALCLESAGGAARRLELQIAESDALIAQHHLGAFSEDLRELQIPLGLRRFGGCEQPLCYLPLMRTDFIRLDRSRLDGIGDDRGRHEALTTLAGSLRGKGIRIIAGMVEDAALLPLLWAAGIHRVQGNCLQPPATTARFRFPRRQTER